MVAPSLGVLGCEGTSGIMFVIGAKSQSSCKNPNPEAPPGFQKPHTWCGGDIPAGTITGMALHAKQMVSAQGRCLERASKAGSPKWENWGGRFGKRTFDHDKSMESKEFLGAFIC